ncbi:MAG TPA: lytic transglycosylase domain-containing protein [Thermoanaerobaculia bacterium]|nr:lytic transglycosylase domain-containing protein [Thermoanaerobaculia bacterium]
MKITKARTTLVLLVLSLSTGTLLVSAPNPSPSLVVPRRTAVPAYPAFPVALYAEAARALRENNLQEARQILGRVAVEHRDQADQAQLISGLYAYEAGDEKLAEEILSSIATPQGALEDWRLYLLARIAAHRGDVALAQTGYGRLIAGHPGSPLRPLAYLEAAELAHDAGQDPAALDLIDKARRAGIQGETARDLEHLAWKIGRQLEDTDVQREAGRRLLVEAPFSADAREAARTFRAMGEVEWDSLLSSGEVKRRAQSFVNLKSLPAALSTLDSLPESERDFDWHLLKANALTRAERGQEALELLDLAAPPSSRAERAALQWERALAAADVATARSGRANLPTAERRRMLERSYRHLEEVVRLNADADLSREALRDLYEHFLEDGLFEQAMGTLRALRRIDPWDDTGAARLWETGWAEYRNGNLSGAVGYWTELEELYPDHRDAHRGRYWKARALEGLGQTKRAHDLYRDVVAATDTSDFYGRRALAQLGQSSETLTVALATKANTSPWPAQPTLRRTKLLVDLGLDGLAEQELDLVAGTTEARDRLALKAVLIGRQGRLSESLVLLREAYPALGGPYQANVPVELLKAYYPLYYDKEIKESANRVGLPPHLVAGIIRQESAFDPKATSPVGARGLMQLMPATAQEMAGKLDMRYDPSRLYDPAVSVRMGSAYFKEVLRGFDGNVELALAGYNGGPNRIRRMWQEAEAKGSGLDDFLETLDIEESRDYVKRILILADSYRQLYPSMEG